VLAGFSVLLLAKRTSANGGGQLSACSEYLYIMAHSICLNVVGDCVWECFRPRILACLSIAGQSGPLCTGTVLMPMNRGIACRKLQTKWAEKDGYLCKMEEEVHEESH